LSIFEEFKRGGMRDRLIITSKKNGMMIIKKFGKRTSADIIP